MRTMRQMLLIGLAALTIFSAWAGDNQAAKRDLEQLQGEWSMVSGTADGYKIPAAMLTNSTRVCTGDELTAIVGGQLVMKAKITLDSSKNPKTIDYEVFDGPTKGKKHLGIYRLEGDTFTSCFGAPDAERPIDFTSKSGDMRTLTVWTRTKPAAPREKK